MQKKFISRLRYLTIPVCLVVAIWWVFMGAHSVAPCARFTIENRLNNSVSDEESLARIFASLDLRRNNPLTERGLVYGSTDLMIVWGWPENSPGTDKSKITICEIKSRENKWFYVGQSLERALRVDFKITGVNVSLDRAAYPCNSNQRCSFTEPSLLTIQSGDPRIRLVRKFFGLEWSR
jgi:hypothetical protein